MFWEELHEVKTCATNKNKNNPNSFWNENMKQKGKLSWNHEVTCCNHV
jgi:hypothetical protein